MSGEPSANQEPAPPYCVAFMCDQGYLFPTLVAAKMARFHTPSETDIIIFLDAPKPPPNTDIEQMEKAAGASIRLIPPDIGELLDSRVSKSLFLPSYHITRSALFRLFLSQLLDKRYSRILYLDGDIQIRRPLTPLFEIQLPEGHVAAVADWHPVHHAGGMGLPAATAKYFAGLHLKPDQFGTYFNSGVMMAAQDTWAQIGREAFDFLLSSPEACEYQDQSALNYACRGKVRNVSLRWNFLRGYMPLSVYKTIDPAIVHFTGRPKPWDGQFPPWTKNEFKPYAEMARALDGTSVQWRRLPFFKRIAYRIQPIVTPQPFADPVYRKQLESALLRAAAA